jgi:hypothetical protein
VVSPLEDERLAAYLRAELARHPAPRVSHGLSARVLARLSERPPQAPAQPRGARLLLGTYWLVTAAASAVILGREPLPAWSLAVLLGLAIALTPLGYAAALWPGHARAWLAAALRPIAPDADR